MGDLRELDAKVAERVFGWTSLREKAGILNNPVGFNPRAGIEQAIPHYSTDPAAATELLEQMRAEWDIELRTYVSVDDHGWECEIIKLDRGPDDFAAYGHGATWMEAACRAALEAMGDEV